MSFENAEKFYEKVQADQGLQQKIGELAKENPQGITTVIINTAKENGYEFNEAEMKAFIAEEAKKVNFSGELDDTELESVAGGGKWAWAIASLFWGGAGCLPSKITDFLMDKCAFDDASF